MLSCLPPFGRYPLGILPEGECELVGISTQHSLYSYSLRTLHVHSAIAVALWLKREFLRTKGTTHLYSHGSGAAFAVSAA